MDGIHTLYNLKRRASGFDTPVVVLTANAIEGSKEMYLKEGFVDYLSKPIDQVELDRILREQLKISNDAPTISEVKNVEPQPQSIVQPHIVESTVPAGNTSSNVAPIFPAENTSTSTNVEPIFKLDNMDNQNNN